MIAALHVEGACNPRDAGNAAGRDHLILDHPFVSGRLSRSKGDALGRELHAVELRPSCADELSQHADQLRVDDFLMPDCPVAPSVSAVIMNPPYSKALAFIEEAHARVGWVAALLRISFLQSGERNTFLRCFPPDVRHFSDRPSFFRSEAGNDSDSCSYMWAFWTSREPRFVGTVRCLPLVPVASRLRYPEARQRAEAPPPAAEEPPLMASSQPKIPVLEPLPETAEFDEPAPLSERRKVGPPAHYTPAQKRNWWLCRKADMRRSQRDKARDARDAKIRAEGGTPPPRLPTPPRVRKAPPPAKGKTPPSAKGSAPKPPPPKAAAPDPPRPAPAPRPLPIPPAKVRLGDAKTEVIVVRRRPGGGR